MQSQLLAAVTCSRAALQALLAVQLGCVFLCLQQQPAALQQRWAAAFAILEVSQKQLGGCSQMTKQQQQQQGDTWLMAATTATAAAAAQA
jgi:hypothetical protein